MRPEVSFRRVAVLPDDEGVQKKGCDVEIITSSEGRATGMHEFEGFATQIAVELITLAVVEVVRAIHWVLMWVGSTIDEIKRIGEDVLHLVGFVHRTVDLEALVFGLVPQDHELPRRLVSSLVDEFDDWLERPWVH